MESNKDANMKGMAETTPEQTNVTNNNTITPHQNWSAAQRLLALYAEREAGYRISRGIAYARNQRKQVGVQGDQI